MLALVKLFPVSSFIAAGLEAARVFSSAKEGPITGRFLLALAGLAAEVVTLA